MSGRSPGGRTKKEQKLGAKDYTDAKVQAAPEDDAIAKAIKEGVKDKEGKTLKKPAEVRSDEEVKGQVELIRGFKK